MGKQEEIRDALTEWAKRHGPAPTILATVQSVDEAEQTCVLLDDDNVTIPGVRLRPVLGDGESLVIFPKVNSWALAVRIESDDEYFLIAASKIDKWRLRTNTAIIEQTAEGLLIQKGADTLKQIIDDIIDSVLPIVVLMGNNPDYEKLLATKIKNANLLR